MKTMFAFALSLMLVTPAAAQTPPPSAETQAPTPLARDVAGTLFPDGTYRKMLGPQMTQMLAGMTDGMASMPLGPLLKAAGLPEDKVSTLDKATLGEVMAIIDPAYQERTRRTVQAMFDGMVPIFEKLEPDLRAGLAVSLDRRFTSAQLDELKAFFATPTGTNFGGQLWMLFMDPAVMGKIQAAMPLLMEAMPDLMKGVAKATADLPKMREYKDLTPAERARLRQLFGRSPKARQ
ncbi:hypothetical protein [Sphingomonas sp.]|uniref:hypothetical protein n=1 Tax=Sphingomonas sp. TaxID=28214 RepID=UPI001D21574D|nr:hypothetical protein [Sphingomonas sp.]MBX9795769.1 hypothetical protein [Sphingomonas sp.]